MRTVFLFLLSLIVLYRSTAQSVVYDAVEPNVKISFFCGICAINPKDINDHISTSNTVFASSTKTIKSVPELSATLALRPFRDDKFIFLRMGYMSLERTYRLSVPVTINDPTATGYTSGNIKESYTAYPFSLGAGITSKEFDSQLQLELIFGLGYIEEEGTFTDPLGRNTSYIKSLYSPAYGLRGAGSAAFRVTGNLGITMELGYRILNFHNYENENTAQPSDIEFSYTGIQASIGIFFFL